MSAVAYRTVHHNYNPAVTWYARVVVYLAESPAGEMTEVLAVWEVGAGAHGHLSGWPLESAKDALRRALGQARGQFPDARPVPSVSVGVQP